MTLRKDTYRLVSNDLQMVDIRFYDMTPQRSISPYMPSLK